MTGTQKSNQVNGVKFCAYIVPSPLTMPTGAGPNRHAERADGAHAARLLSDYSNHCAWVSGTLLAGGSPNISGCDDPTFGPEFWQWQSIPYSTPADHRPNGTNVRGNNCFDKSGTYRRPGKNTCDRGTAVFLTGPTVECANVYVVPDGTSTSSQCAQKDIVRNLNTSSEWGHYCVSWRYVTRDRQWVLVRDQRAINRGGWVYIRTSALPAQRTQWHAYDDDDWASCPPNSN